MRRPPKVVILLYVLLGYVFLQFLWWAYLIYDLNAELFLVSNQLQEIGGDPGQQDFASELQQKLWMIIGEGSVFLTLLLIGAYFIRRYILREHRLARQERNFLLATTHEFNSPLAAIKLQLQTLSKRDLDVDKKKQILEGALSATNRLQHLVSNLLTASRLDARKLELLREEINVEDLLAAIKQRYHLLAEKAENSIEIRVDESLVAYADRRAMETILGNLVENAIKYAPATRISLTANAVGNSVQIIVSDEGPGIDASERTTVFRKFHRAENEETRSQKGSGLGLYLAFELTQLHHGTLKLEKNGDRGARFTLTI